MQSTAYDAIVVGSGISGGWAAKELTEKGLRVLLLERGKNIEHIKDYVNATKGPWEYPHRGGRTREMERHYPVLKRELQTGLHRRSVTYAACERLFRRTRSVTRAFSRRPRRNRQKKILASVSVPILSAQKMSIAPRS